LGERIAYGIFELTLPYHLVADSASDLIRTWFHRAGGISLEKAGTPIGVMDKRID